MTAPRFRMIWQSFVQEARPRITGEASRLGEQSPWNLPHHLGGCRSVGSMDAAKHALIPLCLPNFQHSTWLLKLRKQNKTAPGGYQHSQIIKPKAVPKPTPQNLSQGHFHKEIPHLDFKTFHKSKYKPDHEGTRKPPGVTQ